MPLPGRFLTSILIRRDGDLFLFDAGEGTQVSLKMLSLKWKKISAIFISHMHADHVTGLPGILMLSSQVDRSEPLYIFGPPKLKEYVEQTRRILDMYINYEIKVIPVETGIVYRGDGFTIQAFPLIHTKPCYGYCLVEEKRKGEPKRKASGKRDALKGRKRRKGNRGSHQNRRWRSSQRCETVLQNWRRSLHSMKAALNRTKSRDWNLWRVLSA